MKSLLNTVIIFGTFYSCRSISSSSEISEETTLTTAKSNIDEYPKPSSLYRRINVNRQDDLLSSTPLDLFRVRAADPGRRSQYPSNRNRLFFGLGFEV